MINLSKYFLISIDPIIAGMDSKIDDDLDYDFEDYDSIVCAPDDTEVDSDYTDETYVETDGEIDDEIDVETDDETDVETDTETDVDITTTADELDSFEDVDDEIYAHKPIEDESIIDGIVKSVLFAYSTKDNRRVSLNSADWASVAKLSDIGMDRIFIQGREVFVSGFNKILLKTENNIKITVENLKQRGLHDYAKKIEHLRC